MARGRDWLAGAAVVCLLAGSAGAAIAADVAADTATPPHATKVERKDFAKLSVDGQKAYDDVILARLAIFDGKTDRATTLVDDAKTAFARAATDDTAFMKAEGDLHSSKNAAAAAKDDAGTSSGPVAWLPVDQQYVLDETMVPTAKAKAAVANANDHLKAGETDRARQVLRIAAVGASDTIALVPLDRTTDDVNRAAQLVSAHDWFGASQALRMAQDGVRFDTVAVVAPVHRAKSG